MKIKEVNDNLGNPVETFCFLVTLSARLYNKVCMFSVLHTFTKIPLFTMSLVHAQPLGEIMSLTTREQNE